MTNPQSFSPAFIRAVRKHLSAQHGIDVPYAALRSALLIASGIHPHSQAKTPQKPASPARGLSQEDVLRAATQILPDPDSVDGLLSEAANYFDPQHWTQEKTEWFDHFIPGWSMPMAEKLTLLEQAPRYFSVLHSFDGKKADWLQRAAQHVPQLLTYEERVSPKLGDLQACWVEWVGDDQDGNKCLALFNIHTGRVSLANEAEFQEVRNCPSFFSLRLCTLDEASDSPLVLKKNGWLYASDLPQACAAFDSV